MQSGPPAAATTDHIEARERGVGREGGSRRRRRDVTALWREPRPVPAGLRIRLLPSRILARSGESRGSGGTVGPPCSACCYAFAVCGLKRIRSTPGRSSCRNMATELVRSHSRPTRSSITAAAGESANRPAVSVHAIGHAGELLGHWSV